MNNRWLCLLDIGEEITAHIFATEEEANHLDDILPRIEQHIGDEYIVCVIPLAEGSSFLFQYGDDSRANTMNVDETFLGPGEEPIPPNAIPEGGSTS